MAYTTINKGSDYFNTVTWSGNGSTQSITGVNFQPDTVWLKCRDAIRDHHVYDVIRTAGKRIYPNLTNAEDTTASGLTSFDSDGFSLGSDDSHNGSGKTYVGWSWLGGGAGSSNTDGSITSTVSANTTSGFSIVTYTGTGSSGATVGHGLGSAPSFITVKRLDTTGDWWSYHKNLLATYYIKLNTTDPAGAGSTIWNDTTPTSSVFTLGNNAGVNASGGTYVAYCFAEKKGFSKFGSYTGNGSTDGTFVYTGFKPAFVLCRLVEAEVGYDWIMYDNKRPNSFNTAGNILRANSNSTEDTSSSLHCDFLSNGFKFRGSDSNVNDPNDEYIYMAFAEHPLVSSTGVPCTAR